MNAYTSAENTPIPKEIYNWRVYACACVAAIASVGIGYDSAFIGTSITNASFKKEFGLTKLSTSEYNLISTNIVSIFQAGSFFGAFAGYPVGWFLGRRYGLALAGIIFLIGSVLTVVANSNTGLSCLYAGRVILGFGIGIAANLTPIYIAEIAPAVIRGRLIGFHECGRQVGTIIGFFINYGVALHVKPGNQQWIIPFAVQVIPASLLTMFIPFVYESPRWLANRDRAEDALRSLSGLRHLPIDHPYLQEEYAEMTDALEADREKAGGGVLGPVKTLFSHRYLINRLALAMSLFIFQNGTGINAINYYSPTVFKSIGITGTNTGLLSTGIFGVVKFSMAFVWIIFLIDRFGRRSVLMVGATGGAIAMVSTQQLFQTRAPGQLISTAIVAGDRSRARKLVLEGFSGPFITHGIDIISDPSNPQAIYIHAVNHLPNPDYYSNNTLPKATSRIEIFHHILHSSIATHVRSVSHPLIKTPNDIFSTGPYSFYVTNDHRHREGGMRSLEDLGTKTVAGWSDIIHVDAEGGKTGAQGVQAQVALTGLHNNNGLGHNNRPEEVLIADASGGVTYIAKISPNHTLKVLTEIKLDSTIDNPSWFQDPYAQSTGRDASGLILAGLVKAASLEHEINDGPVAPIVWHATRVPGGGNTESKWEKRVIFQDDGNLLKSASAAVMLAIDPEKNDGKKQGWLWVTGFLSKAVIAVKVDL